MRRFTAALRLDVQIQARSRLYTIGAAVALLMGLAGRFFFEPGAARWVLPVFYLLGIGGTTFMFGASMLLLEKSDGTLQALRVSPLTTGEYLRSKAATLTTFAVVECAIVFAWVYRGEALAVLPLVAGILVLGLSYTYLGIGMASAYDSVTAFLFPEATLVSVILQLPFLEAFGIGPAWLWGVIPSSGPMALMLGAFGAPISWPRAVAMSALLLAGSVAYAHARFRRHVGLRKG